MGKVLLIVILLLSIPVKADDGYHFDGEGLTTSDAYQQMLDHVCLSFMIFLEARGDGKLSQVYHGMATINRVLHPNRWGDTVCDVVLQPSQYESIGRVERKVLNKVMQGDIFAADNYIKARWDNPLYLRLWKQINQLAYVLVTTPSTEGNWIDANHFYSPRSLSNRKMTTPRWIKQKELVGIAGDTHFLK